MATLVISSVYAWVLAKIDLSCSGLLDRATLRKVLGEWTPEFILLLLLLRSIATARGWMMRLYVLHRLPAAITSMSSSSVPIVALLCSAFQLGETPRASELAGMALIVTALAIVSWDTVARHREIDRQIGQE